VSPAASAAAVAAAAPTAEAPADIASARVAAGAAAGVCASAGDGGVVPARATVRGRNAPTVPAKVEAKKRRLRIGECSTVISVLLI
jgi:hypothetical protein